VLASTTVPVIPPVVAANADKGCDKTIASETTIVTNGRKERIEHLQAGKLLNRAPS
jgi:hypothetical protein